MKLGSLDQNELRTFQGKGMDTTAPNAHVPPSATWLWVAATTANCTSTTMSVVHDGPLLRLRDVHEASAVTPYPTATSANSTS